MAKKYNHQKSLRNTGIGLVLIAAGVLIALIWAVIRNAVYAKKYTVAVTGTVISSSVLHKKYTKAYSTVTIQYDGLDGSLHTIERSQLYGEYQIGDTISLRCNEARDEAVTIWDTEQNPIFIGCLFMISLFFGAVGILLMKGMVKG